MTLGIPGDSVMALLLGALTIHGIIPGPMLISEHPDIFWGMVASFWIGNILLLVLNVPLIGLWVRLLSIPYRFLYPSALLLVCLGLYSANNSMFQVGECVFFGVVGYVLLRLDFHPAPALLGFVLGPRMEDEFRKALVLSNGDLMTFVHRPISASFLAIAALLMCVQIAVRFRTTRKRSVLTPFPVGESEWPQG